MGGAERKRPKLTYSNGQNIGRENKEGRPEPPALVAAAEVMASSVDLDGDGKLSADEMIALMNNTKLLMSSSVNGTVMQTGANRDADGTIDRSPPPTPEVQALLFDLKRITDEYGIDMMLEFRTQGATKYGTMSKSRFNSVLTTTFGPEKGFFWDDKKLNVLSVHYGTGAKDLSLGGHKLVAWMDVCEDLGETDGARPRCTPQRRPTRTRAPHPLTRADRSWRAASFKDNQYAHGQVVAMAYETHL